MVRKLGMVCAILAFVAISARTEAMPHELSRLQSSFSPATDVQIGLASWYGSECEGNLTASGALFNPDAMTCAHRSLPLGTDISVTNLLNGRSLVLNVNDRGPGSPGRVLDVTQAAARKLGFLRAGTTPVKIKVVGCTSGDSGNSEACRIAAVRRTSTAR